MESPFSFLKNLLDENETYEHHCSILRLIDSFGFYLLRLDIDWQTDMREDKEESDTKTRALELSIRAKVLWAKTGLGEESHLFSPLYVHMGDTGGIVRYLWREWLPPSEKRLIAEGMGAEEDAAENVVSWLASVHDIGKATPIFQCKSPELSERVQEQGLDIDSHIVRDHASHAFMGQIIFEKWLTENGWSSTGEVGPTANTFAVIVGGHHGAPPSAKERYDYDGPRAHILSGTSVWSETRQELLDWLWERSGVKEQATDIGKLPLSGVSQMLITGLVIMSDWIASNTEFFPLVDQIVNETEFDSRVARAWSRLSMPGMWHAAAVSDDGDDFFHARFENIGSTAQLRPTQQTAVIAAASALRPSMIVIEAPMGNGKTEAALLCAEEFAGRFGEGGLAYLLPTMATSNAMFSRVYEWLEHVPDARGKNVLQSIRLAHSKAELNKDYAKLYSWKGSSIGDAESIDGNQEQNAIAHQWFGGNKTSLLASFVVGTVDQLLMAALRTKHIQLRHLGLSGKVVVIDEVHAYDVYMNTYLDRILAWLGRYGAPVILLSATLPSVRRIQLLRAYKGCRQKKRTSCDECRRPCKIPQIPRDASGDSAYPLITCMANECKAVPEYFPTVSGQQMVAVHIERIEDDGQTLTALLHGSLDGGGCACVIRDTVRRAQETYELLKAELDIEVKLVHSRFVGVDRMLNDEELLSMLGPNCDRRPHSLVVVGTQVIEQSLDIDFDIMISDIAPVDLLLQRMGRLHRHSRGAGERDRPAKLRKAYFYLAGVEDWSAQPPKICHSVDRVYPKALLWKSLASLDRKGSDLQIPADISPLVEMVYEDDDGLIPASWVEAYGKAKATYLSKQEERQERAKDYLLGRMPRKGQDISELWKQSIGVSEHTARMAVRDGEESLEVVVVQRINDELRLLPWISCKGDLGCSLGNGYSTPPDEIAKIAAQCTVSLPSWLSNEQMVDTLDGISAVPGWRDSCWLKGCLPLVLDSSLCTEVDIGGSRCRFAYSREYGLRNDKINGR